MPFLGACGAFAVPREGYTSGVIVEHLRVGQLNYELDKCDELREPPVPVAVRFLEEWHAAELHGWAQNPNGSDDGWRGLVSDVRAFAAGFEAEFLTWVRAEDVRRRRE